MPHRIEPKSRPHLIICHLHAIGLMMTLQTAGVDLCRGDVEGEGEGHREGEGEAEAEVTQR